MRASATSRIASPASLHAPQASANANKADDASPFALLVQSAAATPAQKDSKSAKSDDDSGNAQADVKTDVKTDAKSAAQSAAPATTAAASVKSGKQDKADKAQKTGTGDSQDDTAAATNQAGSADQTQVSLQNLPPAQMPAPPPPSASVAGDDSDGPEPVGATALGQAQTPPQAQAAANAAAPQAPAQLAAAGQAPQPVAPQAGEDTDDSAEPQNPAAAARSGKTARPDASKSPAAAANAARTSDAKTDAAQPSASKADDKAALQAAATMVDNKPIPAAAPASESANTNAAGVTAPQAAGPASAATPSSGIAQHVQVSDAPVPNVPALAVEIAAKSQSGARQFDIRLDPPELGRVEVRLSIDATGKASAHLSADQPQTLDLLQKDAPTLTRALRDAGLDVSQDGLNFSLRQQAGDSNAQNGDAGNGRGAARNFIATTSIDATSTSAQWRAPADGRLDIRV